MTIVNVMDGFLACMFLIVNLKKEGGHGGKKNEKYELDNAECKSKHKS